MDKAYSINVSDYQFDEVFSKYQISEEARKKFSKENILILPTPYNDKEFYFAQESVNFVKFCRHNSNDINMDILSDKSTIEVRALHSFDIWLPIIWISSSLILPTVINLLSNYIYDRIKGRETEEIKVKFSVLVKDGEKTTEIKYDGDAKSFRKAFEKIDINKL